MSGRKLCSRCTGFGYWKPTFRGQEPVCATGDNFDFDTYRYEDSRTCRNFERRTMTDEQRRDLVVAAVDEVAKSWPQDVTGMNAIPPDMVKKALAAGETLNDAWAANRSRSLSDDRFRAAVDRYAKSMKSLAAGAAQPALPGMNK